eukprot:GHVS01021859.1.p1 GENE.GHVS01021859.1~~GHVS01021859.1.p1  ORF type:complete len:1376 (+),score=261.33 GHVS01021859.1:204-4331(+)
MESSRLVALWAWYAQEASRCEAVEVGARGRAKAEQLVSGSMRGLCELQWPREKGGVLSVVRRDEEEGWMYSSAPMDVFLVVLTQLQLLQQKDAGIAERMLPPSTQTSPPLLPSQSTNCFVQTTAQEEKKEYCAADTSGTNEYEGVLGTGGGFCELAGEVMDMLTAAHGREGGPLAALSLLNHITPALRRSVLSTADPDTSFSASPSSHPPAPAGEPPIAYLPPIHSRQPRAAASASVSTAASRTGSGSAVREEDGEMEGVKKQENQGESASHMPPAEVVVYSNAELLTQKLLNEEEIFVSEPPHVAEAADTVVLGDSNLGSHLPSLPTTIPALPFKFAALPLQPLPLCLLPLTPPTTLLRASTMSDVLSLCSQMCRVRGLEAACRALCRVVESLEDAVRESGRIACMKGRREGWGLRGGSEDAGWWWMAVEKLGSCEGRWRKANDTSSRKWELPIRSADVTRWCRSGGRAAVMAVDEAMIKEELREGWERFVRDREEVMWQQWRQCGGGWACRRRQEWWGANRSPELHAVRHEPPLSRYGGCSCQKVICGGRSEEVFMLGRYRVVWTVGRSGKMPLSGAGSTNESRWEGGPAVDSGVCLLPSCPWCSEFELPGEGLGRRIGSDNVYGVVWLLEEDVFCSELNNVSIYILNCIETQLNWDKEERRARPKRYRSSGVSTNASRCGGCSGNDETISSSRGGGEVGGYVGLKETAYRFLGLGDTMREMLVRRACQPIIDRILCSHESLVSLPLGEVLDWLTNPSDGTLTCLRKRLMSHWYEGMVLRCAQSVVQSYVHKLTQHTQIPYCDFWLIKSFHKRLVDKLHQDIATLRCHFYPLLAMERGYATPGGMQTGVAIDDPPADAADNVWPPPCPRLARHSCPSNEQATSPLNNYNHHNNSNHSNHTKRLSSSPSRCGRPRSRQECLGVPLCPVCGVAAWGARWAGGCGCARCAAAALLGGEFGCCGLCGSLQVLVDLEKVMQAEGWELQLTLPVLRRVYEGWIVERRSEDSLDGHDYTGLFTYAAVRRLIDLRTDLSRSCRRDVLHHFRAGIRQSRLVRAPLQGTTELPAHLRPPTLAPALQALLSYEKQGDRSLSEKTLKKNEEAEGEREFWWTAWQPSEASGGSEDEDKRRLSEVKGDEEIGRLGASRVSSASSYHLSNSSREATEQREVCAGARENELSEGEEKERVCCDRLREAVWDIEHMKTCAALKSFLWCRSYLANGSPSAWKDSERRRDFPCEWTRKWFVLRDHCLYYFKRKRDEYCEGFVALDSIAGVHTEKPALYKFCRGRGETSSSTLNRTMESEQEKKQQDDGDYVIVGDDEYDIDSDAFDEIGWSLFVAYDLRISGHNLLCLLELQALSPAQRDRWQTALSAMITL